jgi:hypothetical protein
MEEFSFTVGNIVLPVSNVLGTVWPDLDTEPMSLLTLSHLSLVDCTVWEYEFIDKQKTIFLR